MPIHACSLPGGGKGFKWGSKGKCYADRAQAEKQAEAAYSNGYAGDDFKESDHPRDAEGKFGSSGSNNKVSLTENEKSAISSYSGDDFLRVNGSLRKGEGADDPQVKRIDAAIAKSKLPTSTLYRGMSREAAKSLFAGGDIKKGQIVADPAFASTSTDKETAQSWALGGVMLKIEVAGGSEGLDLSNVSRNKHEGEVLLPRGAKMKVLGITPGKSAGQPAIIRVSYGDSTANDIDVFALDRNTTRTKDADGRMHVGLTNISKANVCPYYGREIPKYEELGLQPDRIYYLYRHPDELAKAVPTFNKIQLLEEHQPVHAGDPKQMITVGALGESAVFDPPYLKNTLAVWDARAISGIETDEKRQLSSSYRYRADMTPGVSPDGVHFDGVMRDIVGNHVALVEVGRAGADVAVGDSQPVELITMKKQGTKRLAMRVAVGAFLRPALAADAAIPYDKLIAQDGSAKKTSANVKKHYASKFEVDTAALEKILALAADEAEKEEKADDEEEEEEEDEEGAEDEEEEEMSEAEKAKKAKDRKRGRDSKRGKDEEDDKAKDRKRGRDVGPSGPEDRSGGKAPKVEDKAHDAALVRKGAEQAAKGFRALREAEELVRPLVGAVAAMDSAEDVLRFALDERGVDHEDVPASALAALVKLELKHADKSAPRASHAADSAGAAADFAKRFPNAVRPGRM